MLRVAQAVTVCWLPRVDTMQDEIDTGDVKGGKIALLGIKEQPVRVLFMASSLSGVGRNVLLLLVYITLPIW
jgi:hypothetical protein